MAVLGLDCLGADTPKRQRKRVGRGPGSGHGKTSGKGHKGQKARSGGVKGRGFEGGQMPIQMRIPKRGFSNARFRQRWQIVSVKALADWPSGTQVNREELVQRGLARSGASPIKLLADGDTKMALTVRLDAVSQAARAKIEAAGGTVHDSGAP